MTRGLIRHRDDDILHLVLDRPDVRNALDEPLIAELTAALREEATAADVRAVVLRGEGKVFCAGADLAYMRRLSGADATTNRADAQKLGALFGAISDCPHPVVAQVQPVGLPAPTHWL